MVCICVCGLKRIFQYISIYNIGLVISGTICTRSKLKMVN